MRRLRLRSTRGLGSKNDARASPRRAPGLARAGRHGLGHGAAAAARVLVCALVCQWLVPAAHAPPGTAPAPGAGTGQPAGRAPAPRAAAGDRGAPAAMAALAEAGD